MICGIFNIITGEIWYSYYATGETDAKAEYDRYLQKMINSKNYQDFDLTIIHNP